MLLKRICFVFTLLLFLYAFLISAIQATILENRKRRHPINYEKNETSHSIALERLLENLKIDDLEEGHSPPFSLHYDIYSNKSYVKCIVNEFLRPLPYHSVYLGMGLIELLEFYRFRKYMHMVMPLNLTEALTNVLITIEKETFRVENGADESILFIFNYPELRKNVQPDDFQLYLGLYFLLEAFGEEQTSEMRKDVMKHFTSLFRSFRELSIKKDYAEKQIYEKYVNMLRDFLSIRNRNLRSLSKEETIHNVKIINKLTKECIKITEELGAPEAFEKHKWLLRATFHLFRSLQNSRKDAYWDMNYEPNEREKKYASLLNELLSY